MVFFFLCHFFLSGALREGGLVVTVVRGQTTTTTSTRKNRQLKPPIDWEYKVVVALNEKFGSATNYSQNSHKRKLDRNIMDTKMISGEFPSASK